MDGLVEDTACGRPHRDPKLLGQSSGWQISMRMVPSQGRDPFATDRVYFAPKKLCMLSRLYRLPVGRHVPSLRPPQVSERRRGLLTRTIYVASTI
jgi:hypothetical protein